MKKSMSSTVVLGLIGSIFLSSTLSFASSLSPDVSAQSKHSLATTKIVGGQEAESQDWPWMTAFVFTFEDFTTSLRVDDQSYTSNYFSGGGSGFASGNIVSCGLGGPPETPCINATGKVCLIERGEFNFSDKALNCEAGGGVAAIIYNNEAGEISGTLGEGFNGTIPVVAVTQNIGLLLLEREGAFAEVNVSSTSELQQSASCGATFLGEKWVLTAAHCVDSPSASLFKMNVGEYDLSEGAENAVAIKNIYIHPQYDADAIDYDIALVELVSSVNSPAVKLASQSTTDLYAIENSPAIVAGWGGRVGYAPGEGPTSDYPDILHEVELNLVTNDECRAILAESIGTTALNTGVTSRMICAAQATSGKGSCQGDSGGPLVIQTGTGPEQVGLVSWGIGCAAAGYPGVFTRVAEFTDWLNAIQTGIAITQSFDFGVSPSGVSQSATLQLTNNSDFIVDLGFTLTGSLAFSLGTDTCSNLAPSATCELIVNLNGTQASDINASVTIQSNNAAVPASSAVLSATVINTASALAGVAGPANANVRWYSGGNRNWEANPIENGVQSGTIGNNQESIITAFISGPGTLSFQWSVSSEENEDDPSDPYDALYLFVNNEEFDFISGEVEFVTYPTITLNTDTNIVTWTYRKDPATISGDDKGYLRNVVFTPTPVTTTPTPTAPTSNNGGGGGAINWLALLLLTGLRLFRKK
ncbi:trypsin-like serine protease [Paraglaciecola sp.]|uniref:trypsin-like serine protease n=1 Tax=Paraglaciecola sp. TaxID=1920173 RepID=UPI00273E0CFA|nr:trypsin-like serine protease [Paraglaciecola sp.]MDP5032059.1 trypsin-like serine protease [Paraglaciecola sp.]